MAAIPKRIRTFLLMNLVLGLWLGAGLWMVRASRSRKEKETAVLIVVLVPLGAVAQHYAQAWADRRVEAWNLSRPEPICPACAGHLAEDGRFLGQFGWRRCVRCGRDSTPWRRWFRGGVA